MKIPIKYLSDIWDEIAIELDYATDKFGSFHNGHEGYAVIKEEVDELWDAIKDKQQGILEQRKECIQIAAMAIRFIYDVCDSHINLDGDIIN